VSDDIVLNYHDMVKFITVFHFNIYNGQSCNKIIQV